MTTTCTITIYDRLRCCFLHTDCSICVVFLDIWLYGQRPLIVRLHASHGGLTHAPRHALGPCSYGVWEPFKGLTWCIDLSTRMQRSATRSEKKTTVQCRKMSIETQTFRDVCGAVRRHMVQRNAPPHSVWKCGNGSDSEATLPCPTPHPTQCGLSCRLSWA